jgi:hypothetical protein
VRLSPTVFLQKNRWVALPDSIARSRPVVWRILAWPYNGGGHRVLSRSKIKICQISILIILKCRILEGSGMELHWALRLEIAGSDGIQLSAPVFLLERLVSEGAL